jgi:hypothetical protein
MIAVTTNTKITVSPDTNSFARTREVTAHRLHKASTRRKEVSRHKEGGKQPDKLFSRKNKSRKSMQENSFKVAGKCLDAGSGMQLPD